MNGFSGDAQDPLRMPNHVLVIDGTPGPEGFGVTCIPHGRFNATRPTHLEAFLVAIQHADRYCKDWL